MRGASSRAQCVHDTTPRCSRQVLRASNNKEHTRYDDNGNTLTKTRISDGEKYEFAWDYRNRLTQVLLKNSGGTILLQTDYTYDAFNRRIIKVHDPDGPGSQTATTTKTIYDGASFAANPYADFDGSNALTMRYVYGPAVDFLLARRDSGGAIAWHLGDHLGTIRDVVSTGGSSLDHVSYSAFGKVTAESSQSSGDRFKFTARELDSETSLQHTRARSFDAATGRWVASDPIGFLGGDTNLYRYVGNSSLVFTDPLGLASRGPLGGFGDVIDVLTGGALSGQEPAATGIGQIIGNLQSGEIGAALQGAAGFCFGALSGINPVVIDPGQAQCVELLQAGAGAMGALIEPEMAAKGKKGAPFIDLIGGLAGGLVAGIRRIGTGITGILDELMPAGKPLGRPGSNPTIREVPGGLTAAEDLFGKISKGGKDVTPQGHPGTLIELPDGGHVGLRRSSKSGPPTIDVDIQGIPIKKIKFQ